MCAGVAAPCRYRRRRGYTKVSGRPGSRGVGPIPNRRLRYSGGQAHEGAAGLAGRPSQLHRGGHEGDFRAPPRAPHEGIGTLDGIYPVERSDPLMGRAGSAETFPSSPP